MHWASDHRRHHRHVDQNDKDPYSAGRGFWFSHIGWILRNYDSGKEDFSNIKDIQRDKIALWQHQHYLLLVLLTNIALPAFLGFLHGDIIACLLLGGLLRLVMSQHVTYLINSIAHMWGKQTYSDASSARDNPCSHSSPTVRAITTITIRSNGIIAMGLNGGISIPPNG